jgi:hypothetical protein
LFFSHLLGWSNVMYALKVLGFLSAEGNTKKGDLTLLDFMRTKFPQGYKSDLLRQYLAARGVTDLDMAMEALHFLGLSEDCTVASTVDAFKSKGPTPIDALCKLLEAKLTFGPGEKDMVAMFHLISGELPDGTVEAHASRLLAFGTPGGDSAMSATVGYTTAAAAELIIDNKLSGTDLKGVLVPTDARIYEPLLKRIQDFGITWTDTITSTSPTKR